MVKKEKQEKTRLRVFHDVVVTVVVVLGIS